MDISHFFEHTNERTRYDYSMLVYGNYTYRNNLEADSFVLVLNRIIEYLNTSGHAIHFTVLVPEYISSLSQFSNVEQLIYPQPSYSNTMRTHFDAEKFLQLIDWKRKDFDIVYSHLPEHTSQIANCIYNNTNLRPKIIGYSHWFEIPENAAYEKTMLLSAIAGILEMDICGVNSKWLKNRVLAEAKKYFSQDVLVNLDRIIQPQYLGIDRTSVSAPFTRQKSVIFNHRNNGYTGWKWFSDEMDELWKKRKDFTVYTTLFDANKEWAVYAPHSNRDEYLQFLSTMQFGVACFESYSAWSLSTTDGLYLGVPYLLPDKLCYPEMVSPTYPYLYSSKAHFLTKFEEMLDNPSKMSIFDMNRNIRFWDEQFSTWFHDTFDLRNYTLRNYTDKIDEIVTLIKKHGHVTKQQILDHQGWGVRVKWSGYRNYLRTIPEIKFTKNGYEYVG